MTACGVGFVLVPGLGLDERSSRRLRARLAATVVPLPGMGVAAPVPPLEVLADRLLDELGEGPIVLVGHSQSCQVVAVAAARDIGVAGVVLLGPTTDPRLADVRVPVTVVRGTGDRLCGHGWAARLASAAPGGRLVELPGAAHMTPQSHPEEVAAVLRSL